MAFIAFLGCDGSGKSAVIQSVTEILSVEGVSVYRGHWCPKLFKSNGEAKPVSNPHAEQARTVCTSILKLAWLVLKWRIAWIRDLGSQCKKGLLIFDRYHADLIVDPKRYRYSGPAWLAKMATRCLPQPDRVFFLDADPSILLSRKQEIPREALERSRASYLALGHNIPGFEVIDSNKSLEQVTQTVIDSIRSMSGSK